MGLYRRMLVLFLRDEPAFLRAHCPPSRNNESFARAVAARCTALQKEQLHHRAEARQIQASAAVKPSACRRRRAEPHGAAVRVKGAGEAVKPPRNLLPPVLVENFCMLCVVWFLYPVRRTGLTREQSPARTEEKPAGAGSRRAFFPPSPPACKGWGFFCPCAHGCFCQVVKRKCAKL